MASLPYFILPAYCGRCRCSTENSQHGGRTVSETKRVSVAPIPLNRVQVGVHTAYEQSPTSQASHLGSCISMDAQLRDKPHGLGPKDDLEPGVAY